MQEGTGRGQGRCHNIPARPGPGTKPSPPPGTHCIAVRGSGSAGCTASPIPPAPSPAAPSPCGETVRIRWVPMQPPPHKVPRKGRDELLHPYLPCHGTQLVLSLLKKRPMHQSGLSLCLPTGTAPSPPSPGTDLSLPALQAVWSPPPPFPRALQPGVCGSQLHLWQNGSGSSLRSLLPRQDTAHSAQHHQRVPRRGETVQAQCMLLSSSSPPYPRAAT